MQTVIPPEAILGYTTGGAVMTLVLPLGFFILVMAAFFFVFTRPHTVPGHREDVAPARPVPPPAGTAHGLAAAAGMPIAPSGGGPHRSLTGTPRPWWGRRRMRRGGRKRGRSGEGRGDR